MTTRTWNQRKKHTITFGEGKTEQHHGKDVNQLVERYQRTGELTHIARAIPKYGDFSQVTDYKTALDNVRNAEQLFAAMPASVRDRVGNRAENLLEFLDNPENTTEAISMGLILGSDTLPPPPPEPGRDTPETAITDPNPPTD